MENLKNVSPCSAASSSPDAILQEKATSSFSAEDGYESDTTNLWQQCYTSESRKADSAEASGDDGSVTPQQRWVASKVSIDELRTKLGNVQKSQRAHKVAKDSTSNMPVLVDCMDGSAQLVPWCQPRTERPPLSRELVSRQDHEGEAAVKWPIPQPLLGQERPRRKGVGNQVATRTSAEGACKALDTAEASTRTEGRPSVCAEFFAPDACNEGCYPGWTGAATTQPAKTHTEVCLSSAPACPSTGSLGHPYTCARACKFHTKPRGCKDGALCAHCHLCHWTYTPKKKMDTAR
mmetsp:Transcript_127416/g.318100  ORF Transcript_127416/g.318100 Transcript_127416/m.318100 type:complete len:292 (-) Transcript_127416:122-997(-)